jgi:uncharacterized protein (DUF2235 family)
MAKNIAVFSDGTGQDGGVRPEQRMSNVFKLYRAARPGPDNSVDARQQVAFYDPGLGTDENAGTGARPIRAFRKLLASVFGSGISTNIVDGYEFILNHYEPGDRIFLVGFSRGAYTARCVANLLMLCGVPTSDGEKPLPRFRKVTRDIAKEAVSTVFNVGAGQAREDGQAKRDAAARAFRKKYGSSRADSDAASNAAPYFIGVFDSVAALGAKGTRRLTLATLLTGAVLIASYAAARFAHWSTGVSFWWVFLALLAVSGIVAISKWRSGMTWRAGNYDRLLSGHVGYARHALAIDETRADFDRVPWGSTVQAAPRAEGSPEPFIQLWFAGNHSDIGGSYPEAESRLSDVALSWMVDEVSTLPEPLLFDDTKLNRSPAPDGLQHCEVCARKDWLAGIGLSVERFPLLGWGTKVRDVPKDAPVHDSVVARFKLSSVPRSAGDGPYRPEALRWHDLFKSYY